MTTSPSQPNPKSDDPGILSDKLPVRLVNYSTRTPYPKSIEHSERFWIEYLWHQYSVMQHLCITFNFPEQRCDGCGIKIIDFLGAHIKMGNAIARSINGERQVEFV